MIGCFLKNCLIFLLLLYGLPSISQRTDASSTFKLIHSDHYLRIQFENDFLASKDYYYTQGLSIELIAPAIKKLFLSRLLLKPSGSNYQYGIRLNNFGFTPLHVIVPEIQVGDRPFAGCLSVETILKAISEKKKSSLTSSISLGVMGPAALGGELQKFIHNLTDNVNPKGWKNQIRNDVIINYQLNYERKLISISNNLIFNLTGEARIGTFLDKLSGGLNLMTGQFQDPYDLRPGQAKFNWYFFGSMKIGLVGYDATMQGGIFNRRSPYTLSANQVSRVTVQTSAGIVVEFGHINLSYARSYISQEFEKGRKHYWGNLSLTISR